MYEAARNEVMNLKIDNLTLALYLPMDSELDYLFNQALEYIEEKENVRT